MAVGEVVDDEVAPDDLALRRRRRAPITRGDRQPDLGAIRRSVRLVGDDREAERLAAASDREDDLFGARLRARAGGARLA